jgi:hypothetical protein
VSVVEPSDAVKHRNGKQKGGHRLVLRASLRPQLTLWLGLATALLFTHSLVGCYKKKTKQDSQHRGHQERNSWSYHTKKTQLVLPPQESITGPATLREHCRPVTERSICHWYYRRRRLSATPKGVILLATI